MSAGASPKTPLGELTVLPRLSDWNKGEMLFREKESGGKGREGSGGGPVYIFKFSLE